MDLNKKRPPKRYTTRQSILDAIDHEKTALALSMGLAEKYDQEIAQIKEWFAANPTVAKLTENQSVIFHGKLGRLKLINAETGIRRRSFPRHHAKLNLLKAVLAEFDTEPMPFLKDASVVVKK